jgi:hypothetical protein
MRGPTIAVEVSGRSRGRKTLDTRTDRHRDHILSQPLAIPNAGITTSGEHIDEALLSEYFHLDVRISRKKRWHNRGQHESGSAKRNVEPQSARWFVPKDVHQIQR